ncbi:MAG: hypothetical protein ACOC6G_02085 [Thermoproteota archaeon]
MKLRYPLESELTPKEIDTGDHWVTVSLRNVGKDPLRDLEVNLNTLDSLYLSIYGTGKYISDLQPKEEEVIPFKVSANSTTDVYVSVRGRKNGELIHRESPTITVKVGREAAELRSLFVMTEPYPTLGETIKCEATVLGMRESEGLRLEFWTDIPSGEFEELGRIETKELEPGEEARYSAEITPKEEGFYTVHAYLYDEARRIGHQTDTISVVK